jgi:hypothetical protein
MPLATQEFTAWVEGLRLGEDVRLDVPPDEDELVLPARSSSSSLVL